MKGVIKINNIKSSIEGFLLGGDSTAAHFGRAVGKILHKTVKWCAIALSVLLFVCAGQIGQYFVSAKEVRAHAIAKWAEENPEKKALADRFISECLVGNKINRIDMETKFISVYDCGTALGAESLAGSVKEADEILVSTAWPLSFFFDK